MDTQSLVWKRHRAALECLSNAPSMRIPARNNEKVPSHRKPLFDAAHLPIMMPDELSAGRMSASLELMGGFIIKNLIPPDLVATLIESIDRAFSDYDKATERKPNGSVADNSDSCYKPFIPYPDIVHGTRDWLRRGGGICTADCPTLLDTWFGLLKKFGIVAMITDHFGEEPLSSLDKCTVRRIIPGSTEAGIEWHQDGSFMGTEHRPVNLWVTLSDCTKSPGLEILPCRLDHIIQTGTHGARYDWSVGDDLVMQMAVESPVIQPDFRPGDAFLFDSLLLHRTAPATAILSSTRYAIETWFFRRSSFPEQQRVPLAF